ncbi:MAG: dephospho-CoA kinase [Roseburia sp.]
MKFIGITGGVGAGKSALLEYLAKRPRTRVMLADEIAHTLMEPGTACYKELCRVFSKEDIFLSEDEPLSKRRERKVDRKKLAAILFADETNRMQVNAIVHPAVKAYVKEQVRVEKERGEVDLLVLEAALLVEEHYDEICDELWYINTREEIRRQRLMQNRGYSEEKVAQIFASQLTEQEYRRHCRAVIDNNGTLEEACRQLDQYVTESMQEDFVQEKSRREK